MAVKGSLNVSTQENASNKKKCLNNYNNRAPHFTCEVALKINSVNRVCFHVQLMFVNKKKKTNKNSSIKF